MDERWQRDATQFCVRQERSIREVVAQMDKTRIGIALIVDEHQKLVGTVTDGDIRRATLANTDLDQAVSELCKGKAGSKFAKPITAPISADSATCLHLLQEHSILHLPLVDEAGRAAGLAKLSDFVPDDNPRLTAVVMAGGLGTRLRPLTNNTPKPMLPVGDKPLMEITLERFKAAGISRVNIMTHYKAQQITEYFGDGSNHGVEINYVAEDRPLGTAGGLGLLERPDETLLVINGDILTQVDFRAMLTFHREHKASLTAGVRRHQVEVPYGVMDCDGVMVRRVREKPILNFFVNAGIYLLEPVVHSFIPVDKPFDMTDVIDRLIQADRSVVGFPIHEYWLDIGQTIDYERALNDLKTGKM
ncbi:MAG: nucleotidyltransferase [Acidobacteria bacterium]|nr:MAG: nucleotidyltransferase [Acidobacteriota bacterium]